MKTKFSRNALALFGLIMLMSSAADVHAQWPTLDIAAIKEAVSSNLQLVKQSKIVTEASKLGGKLNSTIGDAKSSMSKFASDNLAKAQEKAEKLKKEKEKLEEKKKKFEENKEKLEKQKKKYEDAKKKIDDAKKKVDDAKQKINDAKEKVNDAKSKIDEAKNKVNEIKSEVNEYKDLANQAGSVLEDYKQQAKDKIGVGSSTTTEEVIDLGNGGSADFGGIVSDDKVYDNGGFGGGDASADEDYAGDYGDGSGVPPEKQAPAEGNSEDIMSSIGLDAFSGLHESQLSDQEILDIMQKPLTDDMIANMRQKGVDEQTINSITLQKGLTAITGGAANAGGSSAAAPLSEDISASVSREAVQGLQNSQLSGQEIDNILQQPLTDEMMETMRQKGVDKATIENIALEKSKQAVQGGTSAATGVSTRASAVASPLSETGKAPVRKAFGRAAARTVPNSAAQPAATVKSTVETAQKLDVSARSVKQISGTELQKIESAPVRPLETVPAAVKNVEDKVLPIAPDSVKSAPVRTFRQRAPLQKLQQGVWLDEQSETVKVAYSETLAFGAALDADMPDTGIVNNGEYDETIFVEALADYCPELKVDKLSNVEVTEECMKKLIKYQSDMDAQIAASGKALYTQIMAATVTSLVAESMQSKNTAANYETKVLNKMEEEIGSASVTREDISAMSLTNKELQYLLNRILSVYSSQLLMDALTHIGSFDKTAIGIEEGDGEEQ